MIYRARSYRLDDHSFGFNPVRDWNAGRRKQPRASVLRLRTELSSTPSPARYQAVGDVDRHAIASGLRRGRRNNNGSIQATTKGSRVGGVVVECGQILSIGIGNRFTARPSHLWMGLLSTLIQAKRWDWLVSLGRARP